MNQNQYRQTFVAAKRELTALLAQRQRIDRRIAKLQPLVESLQSFYQAETVNKVKSQEQLLGMTATVRSALEKAAAPLSAIDIKERMQKAGFDFSKYTNPLASIHTILKRLVKSREVQVISVKQGKKVYRWISVPERLLDAMQGFGQAFAAIGATAKTGKAGDTGDKR